MMALSALHSSSKHYPGEFKIEAVKKIVECGHVFSSLQHISISPHILYVFIKKYGLDSSNNNSGQDRRLLKELKRVTDERDILTSKAIRLMYAFIRDNNLSACNARYWMCIRVGFTPGFGSHIHYEISRI